MGETLPAATQPNNWGTGAWLGQPKVSCRVCQSEIVEQIHRYRFEGQTLRELERTLRDKHNLSVSFSALAKHFRYHYIVNKNVDLAILHGRKSDQPDTSIDLMISDIQTNSSTFFEAISHLSKSRLEELKRYQEICEEIEQELSERVPPGSDRSGFTNLDRDSDTLVKRWTYLQELITNIKKEMSKTYIDMQKVIAAEDSETIKNHIFMTKNFLLKEFVKNFSTLLNTAVLEGILPQENKVRMGILIKEMMERFEGALTVDFLYQQSIEDLRNEKDI